MHKPRIIFFDIDGTLIDMEKKRITERTLDAQIGRASCRERV